MSFSLLIIDLVIFIVLLFILHLLLFLSLIFLFLLLDEFLYFMRLLATGKVLYIFFSKLNKLITLTFAQSSMSNQPVLLSILVEWLYFYKAVE